MQFWTSTNHWGLLNLTWGPERRYGLHLFIHPDEWRWGYQVDKTYTIYYFGLGPLALFSRLEIEECMADPREIEETLADPWEIN
jgi:hypothetical protein